MANVIKVTCKKLNQFSEWPLFLHDEINKSHNILCDAGIEIYYPKLMFGDGRPNVNNVLSFDVYFYFPTDTLFDSYKDIAYNYIPEWKPAFSAEDLIAYYDANQITVTIEEVSNLDLTEYILTS